MDMGSMEHQTTHNYAVWAINRMLYYSVHVHVREYWATAQPAD